MLRLALIAFLMPLAAHAADIEVRVLNVKDAAGSVRVEVCPEAEWLKSCHLRASAPARHGLTSVVVHDVPPGVYAIVAHHDSDDDTEVNRNIFGIPTEGVGFSRNASILFGAPSFSSAALQITERGALVPITLLFEE